MRVDEGTKSWHIPVIKKGGVYRSGDGGEEPALVTPDLSSDYTRKGEGERKSARIMYMGSAKRRKKM